MLIVLACVAAAPASAALFTFFPLPKAQNDPQEIAPGPDGALWITQSILGTPGLLGRITTAGTASTVVVPADSLPTALTIGPDGALWYSALAARGGQIGRVSTAGVSEVPLTSGDFADGIAAGPDGALWFTALTRIGRLVPGGTMSFFPVPGAEGLRRIVAGPDRALWFIDNAVPAIWRITTAGAIRRIGLPTQFGPNDLAFAADGALWFTPIHSHLISRRDPSGRITSFRFARPLFGWVLEPRAESIAAGPDGAMWFTTALGIGRITPRGEITELEIPDNHGFPARITTGPDNAIWFTLQTANRGEVGRIDVAKVGPQLLVTKLADRRLSGRRGRLLRISLRATHRASGLLRLSLGGRGVRKRLIHAKPGANSVALRLPRRPGTYRLELRVNKPGQIASDSALVTVAP